MSIATPSRPASRRTPRPPAAVQPRPLRPVPDGTEARGFALYVGVDTPDAETAHRLRHIVEDLRARLDEIAPGAESYASVVVAPVGVGGRSVDVVRRTLADGTAAGARTAVPGAGTGSRGLTVDLGRRRVWLDGDPLALTYLEQCLLGHLARCEGRTVAREELIEAVWRDRDDAAPSARAVDVHIRRLRVKLGRYEDVVRTVRGVGYRFDGHPDVTVV